MTRQFTNQGPGRGKSGDHHVHRLEVGPDRARRQRGQPQRVGRAHEDGEERGHQQGRRQEDQGGHSIA